MWVVEWCAIHPNNYTYIAKKNGDKVRCLISLESEKKESYMFHTPSIERVREQAKVMGLPLVVVTTKGQKEKELKDLENAIKKANNRFKIEGVITGAVESVYQSSRIQKICNKLQVECFNPLWQKDPEEYWDELLKNRFRIVITGVSAEGLDKEWLGLEINRKNLKKLKEICGRYKIHLSFEGGEAETFVVNCPFFKKKLKVKSFRDFGSKNSWRRELKVR